MVTDTVVGRQQRLTHDVALPVTSDCTAPGYKLDTALSENFDGSNNFPPPGWSVVDNVGKGHVWQLNDPEGQPNPTGGSGNFADINSDFYGSGARRTPRWSRRRSTCPAEPHPS